jgi:hypothetical protein
MLPTAVGLLQASIAGARLFKLHFDLSKSWTKIVKDYFGRLAGIPYGFIV